MALLASCWLIVESFVVPHGFLKWFCLSFYINPFFLVLCQVFLWLKELKKLLIYFLYPLTVIFPLILLIFGLLRWVVFVLFPYTRTTSEFDVYYEPEFARTCLHDSQTVISCRKLRSGLYPNLDTYEATEETYGDSCVTVPCRKLRSGLYPNLDTYEATEETYGDSCVTVPCRKLRSGLYPNLDTYEATEETYGDSYVTVSCRKLRSGLYPNLDTYEATEETYGDSCVTVPCRKLRSGLYPNLDTYEATEETYGDSCVTVSWLNEYLLSDHYCSSAIIDVVHMSERILSNESVTKVLLLNQDKCTASSSETEKSSINNPCHTSKPPFVVLDDILAISQDDDSVSPDLRDVDVFHHTYTSRMRFFDILYRERLHGINAISNEHLSSPNLLSSIGQSTYYPLLRSLEYDLEMICVGQSCLFWEALNHQYHKVESLVLSDNYGNILLDHNVSGKFQQVEILLTRFVEDEKYEFKGSSSNTSNRLSFQSLLRIPDVAGEVDVRNLIGDCGGLWTTIPIETMREGVVSIMRPFPIEFVRMEEDCNMVSEDYCTRPAQLLEVIDNCINAFWSYIKTYDKKSIWKYKSTWRSHSPVEDPQDLEILYNVAKTLHKKEIVVRNMQGKSKCWMRRKGKVAAKNENENRNLLVAMIDVKLVQMILKMSFINRSHLKWCQEKLDNIDSKQDIVFGDRLVSQLFPVS